VVSNVIQGNLIGLNASGTSGLGNGDAGIVISGAARNIVGGTTSGARNVISANGAEGIYILNAGATNNVVQGNYIGTDASGMTARGNQLQGITIDSCSGNQIGGTNSGAGNVIAANGAAGFNGGVYVVNSGANVIQGNYIGTAADGVSALGNYGHNIDLQSGATNNIIGGTAAGAGNRIAYAQDSVRCGVRVRNGAYNNLISGNAIFSNGALGIDLGTFGITANTDCESGMTSANANFGQNYPTLSDVYSGTTTRVRGTLDAKSGKSFTLQFFASASGDSSGFGEGQVYLGQTNITLSASSCSSNFVAYLPVSVPSGWVITATATDTNNNTSEFCAWVATTPLPPVQVTFSNANSLSLSWTNNGGSFALQQTFSLTPPIAWATVTNAAVLSGNFWVTTLTSTNSSVYYRLFAP